MQGVCVLAPDVVAVGGIQRLPDCVFAFMDMKPEAARSPRLLIEGGRRVVEIARRSRLPVYAMQDTELETSGRFLRHLGFEPVGSEDMWRLS